MSCNFSKKFLDSWTPWFGRLELKVSAFKLVLFRV